MTKRKNKLTRNELITIVISSLALLISIGQLLFSYPLFSKYFYGSKIIGTEFPIKNESKKCISTFQITNEGNKTADDITISLTCFKDDNVTIMPQLDFDVEYRDNGAPLKDIVIKNRKFVPHDFIIVMIASDSTSYYESIAELKNQMIENDKFRIPFLSIIKYADGFGEIIRLRD